MNYRHSYHAGNFADVVKHLILTLLLKALARKPAPWAYIDTHAGAGRYDLAAPEALKTAEYRDGIGRLWAANDLPDECVDYLNVVRALNPDDTLRYYPGSPWIAHALRRTQDRLVLAERQPQECARLKTVFARAERVSIHCADGVAGIKAWVPPAERRGVVLIDPPYERPAEWDEAVDMLAAAHRRWAGGCYAVWYPLKVGAPTPRLVDALAAIARGKVLRAEVLVYPADTPFRLNGCGMLLLNPPWRLDESLSRVLPWIAERLRLGPAGGAQISRGIAD